MATKIKKHHRPSLDLGVLVSALVKSIDALTLEVRKGTAELRRYRRMVQNPGIALEDTPGRGIPDGALLETDRARAMLDSTDD